MKRLRILVADDHAVVRAGVRSLLAERSEWQICDEACTGRETVQKADQLNPDVVIMDFTMPDGDGLDATRQIRAKHPECEVLVLSVHHSAQLVREVIDAGARGYVLKTDAGRDLLTAVETVSHHEPFFTPSVNYILSQHLDRGKTSLTPREREIVSLVASGKTSKEIASDLNISVLTVETHRAHILKKLDLRSASDLTRYAIREKLVDP